MEHFIPDELKEAAYLIRKGRDNVPADILRRSRTLVQIRNSAILLAVGLTIWLPVAIAIYTPAVFFSAMPSYILLWVIVSLIFWYVLRQTRQHAVDIMDLIAEDHPDQVPQFVKFMGLPPYVLIFGPWYRIGYPPKIISRWIQRISSAFTLPK